MKLTVSKACYFVGGLFAIGAASVAGIWPLTVVGMLCLAVAAYLAAQATA